MSGIKIKICGLSRLCDVDFVNEAKPDYTGFVFYEKSRRFVDFETAFKLHEKLDKDIISVGVFVNEKPSKILEIACAGIIDIIQLHGCESEDYIKNIKDLTGKKIIKSAAGLTGLNEVRKNADYMLFDSPGGGTGKIFDWRILKDFDRPFFLAGGINIANIGEAVKIKPFAVDISSGVETGGVKNREKITDIVSFIRKMG